MVGISSVDVQKGWRYYKRTPCPTLELVRVAEQTDVLLAGVSPEG